MPLKQVALIRKGPGQHEQALALLRQVTDINPQLMWDGLSEKSFATEAYGEG